MDKIEDGDIVKVSYTGKLENGRVFHTSNEEVAKEAGIHDPEKNYEPLSVKVGTGQVLQGFDRALIGMKKGEEKKVTVPPEEGYGLRQTTLLKSVNREIFKQHDIEPFKGMRLDTAQGLAVVSRFDDEHVELDFNHPLAGKTLVFEIKVEDIEKG
ncbi:MAG: peptidylprolyl isomerase [Candidatus Hydrothermarchaeales archaeon]